VKRLGGVKSGLGIAIVMLASCGGEDDCPQGTVKTSDGCKLVAGDAAASQDALPSDGAGELDSGTLPDASPIDAGIEAATISTIDLLVGRALVNESASASLRIENRTSRPVIVRPGSLGGANPGDFSLASTATISGQMIRLEPGQGFDVRVSFTATMVGMRSATWDVELCEGGCPVTVTLQAEGLNRAIDCQPETLDFGLVTPNSCQTRPITCTNRASNPATIVSWALAAGGSPEITLASTSQPPVTLTGTNTVSLDIRYCPIDIGRDTASAVVTVLHPNPAFTTHVINISGLGGGPDIQCETRVDLGAVAVGATVTRRTSCVNRGSVPLLITRAMLAQGAPPEISARFTVMDAPLTPPATIPVMSSIDIDLTFAPQLVAAHQTSITIESNDPSEPIVEIDVEAEGIDTSGCTVEVAPASLDFGLVDPRQGASAQIVVRSVGTTGCIVSYALTSTSSPIFMLTGGQGTVGIAQGASQAITVLVQPPGQLGPASGQLELRSSDPVRPIVRVSLAAVLEEIPFLLAPPLVDFGQVPSSCADPALLTVTLFNVSPGPITIGAASIAPGSDPGFTAILPATRTFGPQEELEIQVGFLPTTSGAHDGRLRIDFGGRGPVYVPLTGEGGGPTRQMQTFGGAGVSPIDLLLVVDDSCSMEPYQMRIAAAAASFIRRADSLGADYHIAVTTTDPTPGIVGTLRGMPHYLDRSVQNREALLTQMVQVGTMGSGDEQGLLGAATAVTDAMLLAGPSAGFLRQNADLVVVFVSDEPDLSPGNVTDYLRRMESRPIGNPNVRAFAVTGGVTGCNGPQQPATPDLRYTAAATMTGGFSASICETDFEPIFERIAQAAFTGGRSLYPLASAPAPGTLEVRVNGQIVPARTGTVTQWYLDSEQRVLGFAPGHEPAAGASIALSYDVFCVPQSCGNTMTMAPEQCDDGNANETDACPSTCYLATCGDGFVRATGEQCDDGNTFPGDGCNQLCTIEGCGNGVQEPDEECDLGTRNSSTAVDACRLNCLRAYCHDGVRDTGEQCDDGNADNGDACVGTCVPARCTDGFLRLGVEQCDDGNQIDTDDCSNACRFTGVAYTIGRTNNRPLTPTPGTAVSFGTMQDDGQTAVPIGFTFAALGTPQTTVYVSTNGLIAFDTTMAQSFMNVAIPSGAAPNFFVAWWWDDLHTGEPPTAAVTTALTGTAPNRVRVITFSNVSRFGNPMRTVNAEVRLHETTNVIEVHYGQMAGAATMPDFNATVGWESATGARGADALGCSPNCSGANWPADSIFTYTP
jgi:cysteine-rich repeat protein